MFRAALACCTALALTAGTAAAQPTTCELFWAGVCPYQQFGLLDRLARDFSVAATSSKKTVIRNDYGGRIDVYWQSFDALFISGDTVEVRGTCQSACTLVTARIPKTRLCFARDAHLDFHQAHDTEDRSKVTMDSTLWMMEKYPADIRAWIEARGGPRLMPLDTYWTLPAPELWKMGYRRCAD
jgi:hypothetical protein